ncbi:MAG: hypothetical protein OEW42_14720 [Acidimicrobiia bacterium]|nr:hypothetical protein [Acidimicrobiia bacterium]MDH5236073.1 hypothetical protein [Acidimicrobiia bacterium]
MMTRCFSAMVAVVSLAAVGCGGSDGAEGTARTDASSSSSPDSDDAEGGDDGSGDSEAEVGGSDDASAPNGGLRGAIYRALLADPDFDPSVVDEDASACMANRSVDAVGEDGFAAYGITEDNVSSNGLADVVFEEDDAVALAEAWNDCLDLFSLYLGSEGSSAEQACIAAQITEDDLVAFLALSFQDRQDELDLFSQAAECFALADEDPGDNLGTADGVADDLVLQSLIASLGLDDAQVACIEDQRADGLSIQTDIATIMVNCDLS